MTNHPIEHPFLDFYAHPATMTVGGGYAPMFDGLPHDVASLARIVQGLLLHEHAAPAYDVALSDERRSDPYPPGGADVGSPPRP